MTNFFQKNSWFVYILINLRWFFFNLTNFFAEKKKNSVKVCLHSGHAFWRFSHCLNFEFSTFQCQSQFWRVNEQTSLKKMKFLKFFCLWQIVVCSSTPNRAKPDLTEEKFLENHDKFTGFLDNVQIITEDSPKVDQADDRFSGIHPLKVSLHSIWRFFI